MSLLTVVLKDTGDDLDRKYAVVRTWDNLQAAEEVMRFYTRESAAEYAAFCNKQEVVS